MFCFSDLRVLFKTLSDSSADIHSLVCVVMSEGVNGWVFKMFSLTFFFCLDVKCFMKLHQKSVFLSFPSFCGMCVEKHAYIWSLPPSASSQLTSWTMTAYYGAIVLMLIEYSMWSFHECLPVQFFRVLYQNVHFFPLLISKSDSILGWRLFSGLFPHKHMWCSLQRETLEYANVFVLLLRQESANDMLGLLHKTQPWHEHMCRLIWSQVDIFMHISSHLALKCISTSPTPIWIGFSFKSVFYKEYNPHSSRVMTGPDWEDPWMRVTVSSFPNVSVCSD